MTVTLLVHIAAGGLGILTGFVALFVAKGAPLHRRAGMAFVYAMLTMCAAGLLVAIGRNVAPEINIPAALLTACLVTTALTTVRPPSTAAWWLDRLAMGVSIAVGLVSLRFGWEAIAAGGTRNGMPAFPFLMFGVVGLLAGGLDLRVMRTGRLRGNSRLARHLWRMSFALFIATLSFFLGQADVFPRPLRIPVLLASPVLLVLLTMLYWLWRVRVRRSFTGVAPGGSSPGAVSPAGPQLSEVPVGNAPSSLLT